MDNSIIQAKAQEIIAQEMLRLTADRTLDELMGLYGDIRVELFQKVPDDETPLIDLYSDLLDREQRVCIPETAYQEGCEAAQAGRECNPMKYISKAHLLAENQRLFHERDNMFHHLCELLGDTRGLISDYTKTYRLFLGAINRKIHLFYEWGYYGIMPDDEAENDE